MALSSRSFRVSSQNRKIQDVPDVTPTISAVSDGGAAGSAAFDELRVSVSANVVTGGIPDAYRVVSTPGDIVSVGGSPLSFRGLTPGTNYTFTATPQTSAGTLGTPSTVSAADTPTGAMVPIATSASGSLNFSNIPQNYQDLVITGRIRGANANTIEFAFLTLNGSSSGYNHTSFFGNGSTASSARNATSSTNSVFLGNIMGDNSVANRFSYFVINIFNYRDTTKLKSFIAQISSDQNGSGETRTVAGSWSNLSSITSLSIFGGNGQNASSQATLYGIKAAS